MWAELWLFSLRFSSPAISTCACGSVSAGVLLFPPPGLPRQEPGRQQRQTLMVVPAFPRPDLVVGQPRLPLGPLQAFLHPVLRLEHPGIFVQRGTQRPVGEQVVVLPAAV